MTYAAKATNDLQMPPTAAPTNQKGAKNLKTSNPDDKTGVAVGVPVPKGLKALAHQIIAFHWAVERLAFHSIYLALDAGLGKTIVAAMLANHFKDSTFFYVCPPFLVGNTKAEFYKWCFHKCEKLYVIPDSMIRIRQSKNGEIIYKSPEVELFQEALFEAVAEDKGPPFLIVDEAHRYKNFSAKRTKALMKAIVPYFKGRVIYMSGTPLPNSRAKELWGILLVSATRIFGARFFDYGLKYCGGYKTEFGWDFNGFTNRKEWKARITKSFMLRQKKDVLNLPPKIEGLLTVGEGMPPLISAVERKILEAYSPVDLIEGEISKINGKESLHLATYLRLLGKYKLKWSLPYLKSLLEETDESILIFAIHKETIAELKKELADYLPCVITGDVPKAKRQEIVREYQTNHLRRVFIGNIAACGVGFTLTKASRVVFVEFSWVDGENTQAADRAHRIGQKGMVQVQYIVLKDSFDRKRMEVLLKKRQLSI